MQRNARLEWRGRVTFAQTVGYSIIWMDLGRPLPESPSMRDSVNYSHSEGNVGNVEGAG
jgi:hypothetical protein